jgi:thiol-disulfide isomerase/thioredoxin
VPWGDASGPPGAFTLVAVKRQDMADLDLAAEEVPRRRRRLLWLLGGVALVAGSVGVAFTTADDLAKPDRKTTKQAGAAKIFALEEVRRGRPTVRLLDYQGKPVVLNFFGSWCPPCLREMPDFQAVADRYKGRVAFVGVTVSDTRPQAEEVLRRTGVTYPAAFDPENKVALAYGLTGMPTTVFISPKGELLERAQGEINEPQLEKILERLYFS